MGQEADALASARRNVDAWIAQIERQGLDAIIVTASGCGTMIKDYGFILRNDLAYAKKAALVSALAMDVSEYLGQGPDGGLSSRLFAAAWPEGDRSAEATAGSGRICG
jgi:Fe-S oxidoreductase